MKTNKISIDTKSNVLQFVKGIQNIDFVETTESDVMNDFETSIKQVKQIIDGTLPRKTLRQMLDGQ